MVYVIQVCWQLASRIRMFWSCSQAVSKRVWHIPLLCVEWKTPDDGQRNCPKHVEFYSENKFEKLVHLVGFIIRIFSRCTVKLYSLCLLGVGTPKDPTCHVSGTGRMTGRLFPAVQPVATVQPAAVVVELTWLKTMWMWLFQKTVSSSAWTQR